MPRKASKPAPLAVVRLHEATGLSPKGWEGAVLAAIAQARTEVEGEIVGFEVVRFGGEADARTIQSYRAVIRVAYREAVSGP